MSLIDDAIAARKSRMNYGQYMATKEQVENIPFKTKRFCSNCGAPLTKEQRKYCCKRCGEEMKEKNRKDGKYV